MRGSDTVSRHGGDEFLVLVGEITRASDAGVIAAKILAVLTAPSRVGDHMLRLSASLGIATYPEDGEDAATLISRADAAMYRSKRRRAGGFEFHREDAPESRHARAHAPAIDISHSSNPRHESALAENEPRLRQLREANEQLVIAALTAQQLEAQTEEAYTRQTKFLAMVAHELRNPLVPIRTAAELLNRALSDEPLLAQLQAAIKRQVALVSRLVDDLLDGSRVSAGKFRLECTMVELAGILSLAVETCRPAIEARSQRLTIHLAPAPLLVQGDPVRLGQIFSNLLDNASKYRQGRRDLAHGAGARSCVADHCFGQRHRHHRRSIAQYLRAVRAGHARPGASRRRTGHRAGRRSRSGRGAWRHGRRQSPGRDLGSDFIVTLPMAAPVDA